ncbi:galactose-1-phosphate uridylyltransferase [Prauserella muralis]|uniref:Galactose-1-phosphate uridylyltransferase n=1 Tax=Prauserella muralis TaxID=588067 RepID=A0A2V4AGH7_9PSEU|nr:galactose-1-phosphate uridylyltransferase [Prauserella muralis]PXY19025.1 galactose-1-phosphate uridylyltransferase [Prauserella muralis]TWE28918.1 UDPglucose--hexose-1-phosphate uridylyltransferase [Prauserella muralis]
MTARGELRRDRLRGEWVLVAPRRAARPRPGGACPFCPGPGEDTPPETWRLPSAKGSGQPGWRVRSVPNRFPLSGAHEVVIESPSHTWDLATAPVDEVADVLLAWQRRHRALREGAAQVVVFRNRGAAAGISQAHPHSQVVALPVLSAATRRELAAARERGGDAEPPDERRLVRADDHTVALTPFAPQADFAVRLAPVRRRADFAAVPECELGAVAEALRALLAALCAELADPAYNLIVRTAPAGWERAPFLCWSFDLVPRLSVPAGLELATGIGVLTTTPEEAARRLRRRLAC